MNSSKVWYVTGASQGLGLTLVKKLLDNGYRVAATSRTADSLTHAVGICDKTRFLSLAVDLTNIDSIQESVAQTLAAFGQIDVVVNNAGYGMAGTVEEITGQQVRDIFNINVHAAIDVTKSVLPVMRQQGAGYFINISSVAGFVGAPGWSVYSATKAALTAFSEVLAADVREFGIKVTVAEPSGFRTGFLTKDSLAFTESKIEGYKAVKKTQERYLAMNGQQAGDPEKAAELFIELAENPEPPLHFFMGADAWHRATEKLSAMTAETERWKAKSLGADFQS
ncbi:SDR family oxidoreductase [Mucilaginibacter dorajii]|uniref:SDR family NAD(P)-dependent oxidoreductase n=1 Tax=Mucilaginibacter dorajii TaxID=692994 RepID=A0ABP7PCB7_9SPHI|nr:SDR family oxidoreductase [Mucilaginibacter dorajii]MCS3735196.1 NAD(P)-dependent dehydrogenase (short-subunit alcohol dehydrogenase family) [Mucilaginibacter dorajii]